MKLELSHLNEITLLPETEFEENLLKRMPMSKYGIVYGQDGPTGFGTYRFSLIKEVKP